MRSPRIGPGAVPAPSSGGQAEARRLAGHAGGGDPDVEVAGLGDRLQVMADELEVASAKLEAHAAGLARVQRHALEALQLAHRPGEAGDAVVEVELHHLFDGAGAAV